MILIVHIWDVSGNGLYVDYIWQMDYMANGLFVGTQIHLPAGLHQNSDGVLTP